MNTWINVSQTKLSYKPSTTKVSLVHSHGYDTFSPLSSSIPHHLLPWRCMPLFHQLVLERSLHPRSATNSRSYSLWYQSWSTARDHATTGWKQTLWWNRGSRDGKIISSHASKAWKLRLITLDTVNIVLIKAWLDSLINNCLLSTKSARLYPFLPISQWHTY